MIEIVRSPLGHSSIDSTTIKLVQPCCNIIEIKQTGKLGTGKFGQNFKTLIVVMWSLKRRIDYAILPPGHKTTTVVEHK